MMTSLPATRRLQLAALAVAFKLPGNVGKASFYARGNIKHVLQTYCLTATKSK